MKYDTEHIEAIIKALNDGEGRVRACKRANIHYCTFIEWMEIPEFSKAVKEAERIGNDKIKDICKRKIIEAKAWQSGAWWLERNFPNEYALKSRDEEDFIDLTEIAKKIEELNK